jgi:hypothetical protein
MRSIKACLAISLLIILAGALLAHRSPKEVVRHPQPSEALSLRFDWALKEAEKRAYKEGFWVCYSIRRLMGENSYIGSFDCPRSAEDIPLQDIICGEKSASSFSDSEKMGRAVQEALEHVEKSSKPEKKVWKEVAILFRYSGSKSGLLERVEMSNLSLPFESEGLPLIWLGGAEDAQSIDLLRKLYGEMISSKTKEGILAAAGIHGNPALVIPFLEKVLMGTEADSIRKDAAFWLGQQNDERALKILVHTAKADRSQTVRKEAVFALSQIALEAAVDALIDLARNADDIKVRREAIFWLGQAASKKAEAALESFAYKEDDSEIQEQAVFALSQLPDDEGLDSLIKIAKTHPNGHVRKKAVFWLGESKDPRALNALIEIIKAKL